MNKCKYIKKEGSSCSKNNNCTYPDCVQDTSKFMGNKLISKLKTIFLYLFFALAVGCKSSQESTYVEKVESSTDSNIVLPTKNELIISNLCDTITGKPIDFSNSQNNGLNTVKTTIKDNILTIENTNDSIVYVDKFYKEEIYVDKEVIRYKTDWRIVAALFGVIILFIIFPIAPKVIHGVIRNFFL